MTAIDRETLDYRPCAGILLFDRRGMVFVANRIDTPGAWQMPQGGIDAKEDPAMAALRELEEETGVTSAVIEGRTEDWVHYDFPDDILNSASRGKWRGQKQLWFACRFTGEDREIDVVGAKDPEFDAWRWVPLEETPDLIVPFKRGVYEAVIRELGPVVRQAIG